MQRLVTVAVLLALANGSSACSEEASTSNGEAEPNGNGVNEMSGEEALDAADHAMSALDDVTYTGFTTTDHAGHPRVNSTLVMVKGGCQITSRSTKLGVYELRLLSGSVYQRVDPQAAQAVWGASAGQAEAVANRWFVSNSDEPSAVCALENYIPDAPYRARFEPIETTTVKGVEVKAFRGRSAEGPLSVWVAMAGEPYVMRASGRDKDGPWELTSARFNQGLELAAPADAERLP